MPPKTSLTLLLTFSISPIHATEWTNYFTYQVETTTTTSRLNAPFEYLSPTAHYDCLSFSLENQAYSIMDKLKAYNRAFDYEKLECEEDIDSESICVYLKGGELSNTERNELLASLLMQGFKSAQIYLNGEKDGQTYTLRDINMPFFLPVYFEDQSGMNTLCMKNLESMSQIVSETLQDESDSKQKESTTNSTRNNLNILIYLLLGISILLNIWLWIRYSLKK